MAKITQLTPDHGGGPERRRLHLREISGDADAPLDTVGQDLRAARQRKGEELASVSRALKIRKDHLEALEESNYEALPGRAYALGFIRSYAGYLGLDALAYVSRFKAETAGRWEPEESKLNLGENEEQKVPQGILILAVLLVVAIAYGAYYLTVTASRMLADPVTAVPARLAVQAEAPRAVPAPPAVPVEPAPQVESAAAAALPLGAEYGARNLDSRVTLRLHMAAKVLVQGPDNTIFLNRTLAPGDSYKAPNIRGVTLTTPDSGAVEVIVDGTSLGFLGAKGAIAEGLSLNPQDLSDRIPKNQAG